MKKGGKGHRAAGKLYVAAMWVVVVTAALLSIKNVIIGKYVMAAFLGFIALITANPLWYGMAILRPNARSATFHRLHTLFDGAMVSASLLLLAYGIFLQGKNSAILMIIFGGLGLTVLPTFIRKLRGTAKPDDRIRGHVVGLLTSGIAAYTAFFVFGASTWVNDLLPGLWGIIPWVGPGVIGFFGITFGVKHYIRMGLIKDEV